MTQNALSTILTELRVSGAIVLSQAHPIPWSVRVPKGNELRGYLGVGDDVSVVPFHIAHRGHCDIHLNNGESVVIDANQLMMCANGDGHTLGSGETDDIRSFEEVMSAGSFESEPSGVGHTEVVCGVFMLRNTKHNPLIQTLPDYVLVDVNGPNSTPTMQQLHAMLKDELRRSRQGQSYMLERVLEMLYAESIRIYTESSKDVAPSWLAAINDSRIGPAINTIHARLGDNLSIETLAKEVALSPSRFTAIFKERIGIPPKAYIASQRQAMAARRLLESNLTIQEIAHECGYQSMPSFTKTFVKQFGSTPSKWRSERKA